MSFTGDGAFNYKQDESESIAEQNSEQSNAEYSLTLSSGGSQAFLAGIGTVLACYAAGLKRFRMLGGVSAGSICTALMALGLDAVDLLHLGLNLDFKAELGAGTVRDWLRHSSPANTAKDCRHTGLLQTSSIGKYINNIATARGVNAWPETFWTMATTKAGLPVVFNADGAFLVRKDDQMERLALAPPPVSDAVRMSCSIPGVFAAIKYRGQLMFDGALSWYGFCPVGIQIRHFGADPRKIIACNLSVDKLDPLSGPFHSLCRKTWGIDQRWEWGDETVGVIEFRPLIHHVQALRFAVSRDAKWLAILIAFESCASRLALEGLLEGDALRLVRSTLLEMGNWRHAKPCPENRRQVLSERAEAVFAAHALY